MDIEQQQAKYAADDNLDMRRDNDKESTDINSSEDESEEEEELGGNLKKNNKFVELFVVGCFVYV